MALWKKIIFSGSNASLNQVTASFFKGDGSSITGIISSSYALSASYAPSSSFSTQIFSRAGTFSDVTSGFTTTGSYTVWRSPYTCQIQTMYGKLIGNAGTGSQINVRKSGSSGYSYHSGSNLRLTVANTWLTFNTVDSSSYSAGDTLEFIVSGSTGATGITVQADFIRI